MTTQACATSCGRSCSGDPDGLCSTCRLRVTPEMRKLPPERRLQLLRLRNESVKTFGGGRSRERRAR